MYPGIVLIIIAFTLASVLVVITIPPIIRVARAKNIFDEINHRTVHKTVVPTIGGVSIFIGFTLSCIISTDGADINSLKYVLAALIILFFIGLKDDILIISPRKKFVAQLISALLVIFLGDIHISNFQGILGIHQISFPFSVAFTLLLILATVNAYNLIDGIDGLASGLGIVASLVFGTWFFIAGDIVYAVMSFALMGSLVGFFWFNVFGKTNKLFMGDTGSLIIGMITSVMAIHFIEMNLDRSVPHAIFNSPALAFAVLLVPLFDLVRVFLFRILQKRSPFLADNNHIHHLLLRFLPSHLAVTVTILLVNSAIILFSYYLTQIKLSINLHIMLLIMLASIFTLIPAFLGELRKKPAIGKRTGLRFVLRTFFLG
jgi:UDP-N-acetylmuramyl pentapeptide phosphotransferase/UDP-N-acetylglucosamine-1-phosphate transferase